MVCSDKTLCYSRNPVLLIQQLYYSEIIKELFCLPKWHQRSNLKVGSRDLTKVALILLTKQPFKKTMQVFKKKYKSRQSIVIPLWSNHLFSDYCNHEGLEAAKLGYINEAEMSKNGVYEVTKKRDLDCWCPPIRGQLYLGNRSVRTFNLPAHVTICYMLHPKFIHSPHTRLAWHVRKKLLRQKYGHSPACQMRRRLIQCSRWLTHEYATLHLLS